MCTLAIYTRPAAEVPLVIAANRDEFLDRATETPQVLCRDPWVVAGRDLVAGGTWLGLNGAGIAVGLLNRRTGQKPDPERRSRGLLCLEVLQLGCMDAARRLLRDEDGARYNPFTLLVASPKQAFAATPGQGTVRVHDLASGVHVVTNLEINDPTCPRIAASHRRFAAVDVPGADRLESILPPLRRILSDHALELDPRDSTPGNGLCIHHGAYGTRSSTVLAVARGGQGRYWHADGPPCEADFREIELP